MTISTGKTVVFWSLRALREISVTTPLYVLAWQRADLKLGRHALPDLAHVDLIHRALEDQLLHVGHLHEFGAGLVRGQGHHGVAHVDGLFQNVSRDEAT